MSRTSEAEAKQRRREYYRKWRAEHREQVQAAQKRYWLKKAGVMAIQTQQPEAAGDPAQITTQ